MFAPVIPFPVIDPVLVQFGPLAIRWYALAYIFGLVGGWLYARHLVSQPRLWGAVARPSVESLDDLLVYCAFGVILGGRIGYVLFYNFEHFIAHPAEIVAVWSGGMSFHGGFAGAALGIWLYARRNGVGVLSVADLCAPVTPLGLLFGRIANFIKPELWGRASDAPWAMVFPEAGPIPRHPSQLYEAGLEGLVLLVILYMLAMRGGFRRPGFLTGVFSVGYGLARIFCEFFREPDPQLGFLFGNATMGMLLSAPLVLAGVWLIVRSRPQALRGETR